MQQMTMAIAGMHCGGCVTAVRQALQTVPGLRVDAVAVGSAQVTYDDARATPETIAEAIRQAGYQPGGADTAVAAGAGARKCGCCG